MKGIRLIGVVAAVLLLLAIGSGIAFAEQDETDSTNPALSEAPASEPGPEVVADRTATSQTFELPGGALETRIFLSPINYRDEQGQWQPIEEGFEEVAGSLSNAATPCRTRSGSRRRFSVSQAIRELNSATTAVSDNLASRILIWMA